MTPSSPALSITEKRQQEIAFSDKLYAADSRLIAAKGSPIQPTLEALKGKHVGVLQGSTQEAYANDRWRSQGVDVVAYQNQDLIYSDLSAGRLDAALQDEVAASEGFLKQPAGKDFAFAGPSVKDKKYFGDGTGIGLRKDDAELKAAFDKALGEMRKDGTYDKMAKKYFDFQRLRRLRLPQARAIGWACRHARVKALKRCIVRRCGSF